MTNSNLKMRSLVSLAFFGSLAHGHMRMATPKTWGNPIDRAPITAANYPCGSTGDASFFSGVDTVQMAVGSTQKITFDGSAAHHGGSCQFAVTADAPPTKTSAWQVILSIQGGCPSKEGGSTGSDYDVVIPDGIAPGKYTFAWTWIPYTSGGPEFYMNCSPIEVTGGKSKRSHDDDDYDDDYNNATALAARAAAFPNLNVINLAGINDCMVDAMGAFDTIWPDPGSNLQKLATYTPQYKEIKAGTPPCAPGGSSSGGSSGGGAAAAAASPSTAAAAGGSGGGDGFKTEIKSATGAAAPATTAAAAATSPAAAAASPSSGSSGSSGSSSGGGQTGACAGKEGTFNCVGGTKYQQCASGGWAPLQDMPAGVKCKEGESATLWA